MKGFSLTKGVPGCFEVDSIQRSTATQTNVPIANVGGRFLISRDNSRGLLNLTEWTVEETCFGDLLRGPNGETFLPTGLLEEVADSMKQLSKRETFVCLFVSFFFMYIILEAQMFRRVHET